MTSPIPSCVVDGQAQLGEGPVWDVMSGALYWCDILGARVHRLDADGELASWTLLERVSAISLRASDPGQAVVALASGFAFLDLATGALARIADVETDRSDNRLNDGKCDRQGRFWCGSMHEKEEAPHGDLYSLDADLAVRAHGVPAIVSNGLAWSPDARTVYVSDSPTRTIYRADFDAATGRLGLREVFARTHGPGYPDGATVDAEGYLWSAEWDGWRLTRYAPDGSIDRHLAMPVQRPTCPAFGGADLSTLYVTSARTGLDEAALADQPQAGGLFAVDIGVAGLADVRFAG